MPDALAFPMPDPDGLDPMELRAALARKILDVFEAVDDPEPEPAAAAALRAAKGNRERAAALILSEIFAELIERDAE
jgi:hypothetical protein